MEIDRLVQFAGDYPGHALIGRVTNNDNKNLLIKCDNGDQHVRTVGTVIGLPEEDNKNEQFR